jgi:glyoxylase-like metal-dependent hydrolase (beta-lactamase superfamily II)
MAEEPVLIDTGIGLDGDDFIAAVSSIVAPERLRWVWLTHDDADHSGSIQRIMELAPNAKLVTHGFSALRMGTSRPGRLGWATSDSPWAHVLDRERFGQVLDRVRQLQPTRIFSSHLPAASGTSLEAFLEVLESVPDAEPFIPQTPTSSPR